MDRVLASLLVVGLLSVQASLLPCPMAGGVGGHEGHGVRADHARGQAAAGPVHGASAHGHDPSATGPAHGRPAPPPSQEEAPPTAPVPPGGCGALMACGLAALAATPRPGRDVARVAHAARPRAEVLDSAPAAPVEPPPPRA